MWGQKVHGIAAHPVHRTLLTVGSDGGIAYWDQYNRTKLSSTVPALKVRKLKFDLPLTACDIRQDGKMCAFATGYDWAKVHDIAAHPVHKTMMTVGSDGGLSYWDQFSRLKLPRGQTAKLIPPKFELPLTACHISKDGKMCAFATGYDWAKGHAEYDQQKMKPHIYLRHCFQDLDPGPASIKVTKK